MKYVYSHPGHIIDNSDFIFDMYMHMYPPYMAYTWIVVGVLVSGLTQFTIL